MDRTIARLSKSLKWRRTDLFEGNSVEAIVARTERALKNNNIEKAVSELEVLLVDLGVEFLMLPFQVFLSP